ncbi:MAG: FAD-binding protein, partial [Atopobiaceae bacterium]|nr:FAD-binding protein [Atopobiaceae bacterium]
MVADGIDVLVGGAGLAGVSAAIEAARAGARVALASLGDTFSGSSFYGGTWGLGLVGPADDDDVDDFVATILDVGRGVADPALVRMLVEGVDPAVAWLEGMGVELRRPSDATQRAYVPCFDHRRRGWHGLVRASLRAAWNRELGRLGVILAPQTELLDLLEEDGRVVGALVANHATGRILR